MRFNEYLLLFLLTVNPTDETNSLFFRSRFIFCARSSINCETCATNNKKKTHEKFHSPWLRTVFLRLEKAADVSIEGWDCNVSCSLAYEVISACFVLLWRWNARLLCGQPPQRCDLMLFTFILWVFFVVAIDRWNFHLISNTFQRLTSCWWCAALT